MANDAPQTTIRVLIGRRIAASCCGDCPRGSSDRAARLVLTAMADAAPTPAMQRALMGLPHDVPLTGAQSAEAITRYRAMMEAARHGE